MHASVAKDQLQAAPMVSTNLRNSLCFTSPVFRHGFVTTAFQSSSQVHKDGRYASDRATVSFCNARTTLFHRGSATKSTLVRLVIGRVVPFSLLTVLLQRHYALP